tara:strand:+ start:3983 stop:4639 length:657 start_codon:yes stop_codon:yes gene_type:complete
MINFKSKPKETFFAPEWDYYLFEKKINKINFANLAKFILSKEKEILKLPVKKDGNNKFTDGYTGLGEKSTTARFDKYNVLNWNNKDIKKIKNEILIFHKDILNYFKQPLPNELYINCWTNIMRKGEKIKPHIHGIDPTTYLGGHICVQCDDTSTHYLNPINQINDPLTYESTNEVGKITLFQNNIPHYTDMHDSDKERVTIAFDLHTVMSNSIHVKLI